MSVEESIQGQWLAQTSTLSSQQYSYDKAGRLTLVKDTPKGGGCTTRSYSYDKNSNRTARVTRAPGIGGVCDTSSAGTQQTYNYDAGDRLLGTGIVYDNYGRITSLPASYAGGSTLTSTYYSNDLIASQAQAGVTNSYQLDAMLRQRQRTQTGGSEPGTEIYHYASGSDSPAWIDRGSSWSRSVVGIDGGLAAIQDSAKGTTLQLTNLHGDVVATASTNPEATKLLATFESDEFGNPKQSGGAKYGWLGGKQRRTELPSGVIQMGVRSYVPAMGRFTTVDPVLGGSANAYEYAMGDPINMFDLDGRKPYDNACMKLCTCHLHLKLWSPKRGRMGFRIIFNCPIPGSVTGLGRNTQFERRRPYSPIKGKFEEVDVAILGPPRLEAGCPDTNKCQKFYDVSRTFACEPGREYQVIHTRGFMWGVGDEAGQRKTLKVAAQEQCSE